MAVLVMVSLPERPAPLAVDDDLDVLLISMDTTRPDHLGCYGHTEAATPNIDQLAAAGVRFTQCLAPVPLTLPTHSSLFTGTDPYVHGVRDNGHFHLHEDHQTLAESLQAAGWATGAEVAAFVLNREFGLDQGFDTYHDTYGDRLTKGEKSRETYSERSAREIADGAIGWLRENREGRFFLFLHFFDPHFPYAPPSRFAGRYSHPYLGEIAYVDEQIGRVLQELESLALADNTLVILTADHGESFGRHGERTHGVFVYDTTLKVPLILRSPGRIPAGKTVGSQVRIIDIAPTVLDFLGIEPLANAQGESLLPLLAGNPETPDRPAYGESLFPELSFGLAPLRSLRADGWKYIHAPKPELYFLDSDPEETRNLAAVDPQRAESLRRRLYDQIETAPVVVGAPSVRHAVSAAGARRLEALGYITPGAPPAEDAGRTETELLETVGPDPKDHIEHIDLSIRASAARDAGDLDGAERALREIFVQSPEPARRNWWALRNLGLVLMEKRDPASAVEYFERALALRPDDSVVLTDLGLALAQLDRTVEALEAFGKAVELEPVWARTHWRYAQTLRLVGESEKAILHFRRALDLDPQVDKAWYSLGFLQVERGDYADALDSWRAGLALSPGDVYMVNNLAWLLAICPDDGVRNGAEAVRLAEKVRTATSGEHAGALHTLAAAYAEQERFDEAITTATQARDLAEISGNDALLETIAWAIGEYERGRPYREGRVPFVDP